jgi:serine/threonine protein kinase
VPQPALVQPLRRWDPDEVGGYVLLGRLGAGAMGQVYLGRSAAGRLVAVKTIKSELAEEPDFRTRFGQEVAAARRVSGAFTAAVVAADSEADVPWLATVYVPAPSLSRLIRSCGPLPATAVQWLAAGCAEALEAIHGVGLVHRDLKPSNVLVSPDGPRVIDFGVARAVERIQLTVTRGSIGTPAYMAPEQARDTRQATPASDVFSLGATILFAATGHAPYEGETVMDVLVRLATEAPDLAGLPAELTDLVQACLERDPRRRPSPASIVARLAPALDPGGNLGPAALPPAALQLIDEFRQAPATASDPGAEPAGESTLGSQPLPGRPDSDRVRPFIPLGRNSEGADPPLRSAASGTGRRGPRQAPARGWIRTPATRSRRVAVAAVAAAAAGILIGAGWAVGTSVADSGRPQLGPILQAPPGGLPPPGTTSHGAPNVALNQPNGDPDTTFVIHGSNWPPGHPITVTLVGVRTSPIHPIADRAGTFNYAINQDHEFVRGRLPPGVYTVRVTDSAGASAKASFEVQR